MVPIKCETVIKTFSDFQILKKNFLTLFLKNVLNDMLQQRKASSRKRKLWVVNRTSTAGEGHPACDGEQRFQ